MPGPYALAALLCLVPIAGAELRAAAPEPRTDLHLPSFFDCLRENEGTLIQAHRAGRWPGIPENSIAAIEASLAAGAVLVELDVARTADGALILMHDASVNRTTSGQGRVEAMTFADIARLDLVDRQGVATGEPVPTLESALDALSGRGIAQLDRKGTVTIEEVAAALEGAGAVTRTVLITYSLDEARAVHDRLPEAMLSVGIATLADLDALDTAGIARDHVIAWLGVGHGDPVLDAALAGQSIESSYGDFGAEQAGRADYAAMAANGAEVLSVDRVAAAARAVAATTPALLSACSYERLARQSRKTGEAP